MTDFYFESINAGPDGAHLLASWCGVLFSVSVTVAALPADRERDTPSQRLTRLILQLVLEDPADDELYDRVSTDIIARILRAGCYLLRGLIAAFRTRPRSDRLADHLFLPVPYFQFRDARDADTGRDVGLLDFAARPNAYFPARGVVHAHPGAHLLRFGIPADLPEVHVDEVRVVEPLMRDPAVDHVACRAVVRGREVFCKAERGGVAFGNSVVGRDFRILLEIRAGLQEAAAGGQQQQQSLRVPRLRGVIRHPREGHVMGFLRDWVPGTSLEEYDLDKLPDEQRGAWDRAVTEILGTLDGFDIYWGNAEHESVVIDNDNNPWVIGFGTKLNLGLRREDRDDKQGDGEDYERDSSESAGPASSGSSGGFSGEEMR